MNNQNDIEYSLLCSDQFYVQEYRPHVESMVKEALADPKADVKSSGISIVLNKAGEQWYRIEASSFGSSKDLYYMLKYMERVYLGTYLRSRIDPMDKNALLRDSININNLKYFYTDDFD